MFELGPEHLVACYGKIRGRAVKIKGSVSSLAS